MANLSRLHEVDQLFYYYYTFSVHIYTYMCIYIFLRIRIFLFALYEFNGKLHIPNVSTFSTSTAFFFLLGNKFLVQEFCFAPL